jgi:septum formation protein
VPPHPLLPARRLVLASTSRYRQELMRRLGAPFEAVAPDYEEQHDLDLPPEELVLELALRKARSVAPRFSDALIIGSDQLAELEGQILLKPGTAARARKQLARLAGRTHRLLTGLVVLEPRSGRVERDLDLHRMTLRPLSDRQIAAYVAQESPLDCAGSYKVEGPGVALFAAMEGQDYTGIIGLPLTRLVTLLLRF